MLGSAYIACFRLKNCIHVYDYVCTRTYVYADADIDSEVNVVVCVGGFELRLVSADMLAKRIYTRVSLCVFAVHTYVN